MAVEIATAYVSLVPSARGFGPAIARELDAPVKAAASKAGEDASRSFSSSFASTLKTAAKAVAVGVAGLAAGAGLLIKESIESASDLNESMNKAMTIFGQSGREIFAWAQTSAKSFGLSRQAAFEAAGSFGNMFSQLGIGLPQTTQMSRSMTELAADFASFHNADITEVLEAQQAAFRGEYDAVQRFVPTINAAAVEQRALADTGKASTEQLTAGEKALATYALLMEGAGQAVGDFDRTSDGAANKQRILNAQIEDAKARFGTFFLPIVATAADFLSTKLLPAIEEVGSAVGGFFRALQGEGVTSEGVVGVFERIGVVVREVFLDVFPKVRAIAVATFEAISGWIRDIVPPIRDWVENVLTNLGRWWDDHGPTIIAIAQGIGIALLSVATFAKNAAQAIVENWNKVSGPVEAAAIVISALLIPALIRLGVQAVISAAQQAAAWVVMQASAIKAGIVFAAQTAAMVAQWVVLGVQSLLHAAKVALAWIIATGPVGLAVAAVAAAVALIIMYWDEISAAVTAAVRWVIDFVTEHWKLLVSIIGGPLGAIVVLIITHWDTITGVFQTALDFIVNIWTTAWNAVWAALEFVWGLITTFFVDLPGKVIGWFFNAQSWLWNAGINILTGLLDGIGNFWSTSIAPWFAGLPDALKGFFTGALEWLLEAGKNIFRGIKNGIAEIWNDTIDFFKGIPSKILDALGIASPPQWAIDAGKFIMEGVLKGVGIGSGELLTRLKQAVAAVAFKGIGIVPGGFGVSVSGVEQWRATAIQALQMAGQSPSWATDLLLQMAHESGGNPRAINLWDSNARKGTPSMGLMQTIGPTFDAYAGALRGRGIFDPLANIFAAINYTLARYGDLGAWRRRGFKGYETGGVLPYTGLFYGHQGETVFRPDQMRVLGAAIATGTGLGGSAARAVTVEQHNYGITDYRELARLSADEVAWTMRVVG
jgi:phage-related protein